MKLLALVPAVLLLCGCAANSYCTGEQPYQKAASVPPLKSAGDLKLPESAGALKIPPPPATPVAYGEVVKDKDGDEKIACLDKPPELALAPEAPVVPVAPVKVETPPEAVPAEAPKKPVVKKKAKAKPNKVLSPADPAAPPPPKQQ